MSRRTPNIHRHNPEGLAGCLVGRRTHHIDWVYDWSNELEEFVATHGKGFLWTTRAW